MKNRITTVIMMCVLLATSGATYAWDYWYSPDSFYDDDEYTSSSGSLADSDDPQYGEFDPNSEWIDEIEVKYKESSWSDWGIDDDWWRTDDDWERVEEPDYADGQWWEDEDGNGEEDIYYSENYYHYKHSRKVNELITEYERLSTNDPEELAKMLGKYKQTLVNEMLSQLAENPNIDYLSFTYKTATNETIFMSQSVTLTDDNGKSISFDVQFNCIENDYNVNTGYNGESQNLYFKFNEAEGNGMYGYAIDADTGTQYDLYAKWDFTGQDDYYDYNVEEVRGKDENGNDYMMYEFHVFQTMNIYIVSSSDAVIHKRGKFDFIHYTPRIPL